MKKLLQALIYTSTYTNRHRSTYTDPSMHMKPAFPPHAESPRSLRLPVPPLPSRLHWQQLSRAPRGSQAELSHSEGAAETAQPLRVLHGTSRPWKAIHNEICLLWSQKALPLVSQGADCCTNACQYFIPAWTPVTPDTGSQTAWHWHSVTRSQ